MSNPFSAAIGVLREFSGRAYENSSSRESCETAIRVLEAAGKVDKRLAIVHIVPAFEQRVDSFKDGDVWKSIRALLAALPDPPKKEE